MEKEIKNCQNCKNDFVIEQEDFNFYEKINVPAPTWCPECRLIRRWSFANTWSLYWRNCDMCQGRTMSMYSAENTIEVYCPKCWWSDSWDGTEYAMGYDPSRSFLEQVEQLSKKTPFVATESLYSSLKNSEYSNGIAWSKNCYQAFWADYCDNVYYSSILRGVKDTVDSLRVFDSELCYESISQKKAYQVFYSTECDSCVDVWFSRNCYSCTNCVGCVNLRGASYQIFNIKYSKEEYTEKLKELRVHSYSGISKLKKEAEIFLQKFPYREYSGDTQNLNVTGEYVYGSKNSKEMYMCSGAENSKYCQFITVKPAKDCMDYSGWGNNAELIYESAVVGEKASHVKFSYYATNDLINLEYCIWNTSAKNNFGCVNLKRKSYCILNKEYSKEEFEKLKAQIIEDMKVNPYVDKLGRKFFYGEFFPPEMSLFSYNKSNAMRFFPKTKEDALAMGYTWDDKENPNPESTIKSSDLPDTIAETTDKILSELIECSNCARSYKIVQGELNLLRKMGLPVPHECPKCRENARFARMTKPGMYHRDCNKCGINIYTPYSKEDPRIVYCVKCYQALFA